jgi:hypothetical protein
MRTSGAAIELEFRGSSIGLERSPRGTALLNLLDIGDDVEPSDLIDLGGGLLAHYRLNSERLSPQTLTLWQGRYSDLYCWGIQDVSAAVHQFASLAISDFPDGAAIRPPPRWSIYRDFLHVDCDPWFVEVHGTEAGFRPPPWPGHVGSHVALYSFDDSGNGDPAHAGLYAFSDSAGAMIQKLDGPIADAEVTSISRELSLTWLELSEPLETPV